MNKVRASRSYTKTNHGFPWSIVMLLYKHSLCYNILILDYTRQNCNNSLSKTQHTCVHSHYPPPTLTHEFGPNSQTHPTFTQLTTMQETTALKSQSHDILSFALGNILGLAIFFIVDAYYGYEWKHARLFYSGFLNHSSFECGRRACTCEALTLPRTNK